MRGSSLLRRFIQFARRQRQAGAKFTNLAYSHYVWNFLLLFFEPRRTHRRATSSLKIPGPFGGPWCITLELRYDLVARLACPGRFRSCVRERWLLLYPCGFSGGALY